MGRKKSVQKIPSSYILVCPHCSKSTKANVSKEYSPVKYECPKCKQVVERPLSQCCVICAYSKNRKPCPRALYMEATIKKLEIKYV